MIVCSDDNVSELLEKETKNILNSVDKIKKAIHISQFQMRTEEKNKRKQNPYIVKSVIKYMDNGLNKEDAITLTAADYNTSFDRVSTIFWGQARYMSAINLYAKRYLCEKLKNAGFIAKDIALILGISENHVFKILKCKTNFWFLDI